MGFSTGGNGFTVFTQDGSNNCTQAKELLLAHGFAFEEINLSEVPLEDRIALMERFIPWERTVPKVYYNGVLIGGYSELKAFLNNPLTQIIQEATPEPIFAKRLSPTAIFPTRGSDEAIGIDLYADLGIGETLTIPPNEIRKIPIGWALKAPRGHYLRIAPRSGLALKGGVDTLGGVVDRDYRGEMSVILVTHNFESVTIKHGDRVAQIIAERASIVPVIAVSDLDSTVRGDGAFGSTGC